MLRLALLMAVVLGGQAWAQGADTPSGTATPGGVKAGVLQGAATTDETTTGSSGPQQVQAKGRDASRDLPSTLTGGPCERIREQTARSMCTNRK